LELVTLSSWNGNCLTSRNVTIKKASITSDGWYGGMRLALVLEGFPMSLSDVQELLLTNNNQSRDQHTEVRVGREGRRSSTLMTLPDSLVDKAATKEAKVRPQASFLKRGPNERHSRDTSFARWAHRIVMQAECGVARSASCPAPFGPAATD
jgi:hypothetical protein